MTDSLRKAITRSLGHNGFMVLSFIDPSPWVKFQWKGVDMFASLVVNLITAVMVAIGSVLFLRWRKGYEADLERKIKWKYELDLRKRHVAELRKKWNEFVFHTEHLSNSTQAHAMLREVVTFLHIQHLDGIPNNQMFLKKWNVTDRFAEQLRPGVPLRDSFRPEAAKELHEDIKQIALPNPERDREFPWPQP